MMTDFEEKKYCIDPGIGKKMDGCPYSNYEDGHDVKDYIIPPKGYVFTGFRFDPDATNQIYDGKLYAQYAKEPFKITLKSNMWKFMLIIGIVVIIGVIILLATSVFKNPKSPSSTPKEPITEVTTNPSKELEKTDNSLSRTTPRNKESRRERRAKEREEKREKKEKEKQEKLAKKEAEKELKNKKKTNESVQQQQEPVAKTQEQVAEQVTQPQEPAQPVVTDPNILFKQEFWDLIHQRNPSMDAYTDLYNKYKADVKGDEFNYLRYTILKNYVTFKAWYDNLKLIPESQLQSIESVDVLTKKINQ